MTKEVRMALWDGGWKPPLFVRSGMSGGLEFNLEYEGCEVAISCMYSFEPPKRDDFVICLDDHFYLAEADGTPICQVKFMPEPTYYSNFTTSGKSMASVGQQCFMKLAIGVFGLCSLNLDPNTACQFCAIHSAQKTDSCTKSDLDILETVDAVRNSELGEVIDTVMLGGGTPSSADRGAKRFSNLAHQIGLKVPWRITAMMVPPSSNDDLRRMRDSGIKEVSINLEFGSEKAFREYTPGKERLIGRKRYLDSLSSAAEIFGNYNVQSLLVLGLEDSEKTLEAVEWLAKHHIIPVLSPFRPLPGTMLSGHPPPTAEYLLDIYKQARQIVNNHGGFLGPRCIPCQCNTMSLPWDVK